MAAPVFPAETMAAAFPSRTASAARTRDASFLRRTPPAGSSPMPMTSDAGMRGRSPQSRPSGPTRTTSMPSSSTARWAPARISPGALSPPMASTAMGSIRGRSDVDGHAVLVPAAAGAHDVGQLGGPASWAERAGRLREPPRAGSVAARLRLRPLLLGHSHRQETSRGNSSGRACGAGRCSPARVRARGGAMLSAARPHERPHPRRAPARSGQRSASRLVRSASRPAQRGSTAVGAQSHMSDVAVGAAGRADAGAVVPADRGGRQLHEHELTDHRPQVQLLAVEGEGVLGRRVDLVQLLHVGDELAGRRTQAAPARAGPGRAHLAVDGEAVAQALDHDVDDDRRPVGDLRVPSRGSSPSRARRARRPCGWPAAAAARRRSGQADQPWSDPDPGRPALPAASPALDALPSAASRSPPKRSGGRRSAPELEALPSAASRSPPKRSGGGRRRASTRPGRRSWTRVRAGRAAACRSSGRSASPARRSRS